MSPFGRWEPASQVLRNVVFYLRTRNPSMVQIELLSGCWDSLLEFEELDFPLDLIPTMVYYSCFSLALIYSPPSYPYLQVGGIGRSSSHFYLLYIPFDLDTGHN